MKIFTGVFAGAVIGGYLVYQMTPDQRDRVAAKTSDVVDKVRSSSVADSLSTNIGDVVGAVSDRVAGVVDAAGSTVTDTVGPGEPTNIVAD